MMLYTTFCRPSTVYKTYKHFVISLKTWAPIVMKPLLISFMINVFKIKLTFLTKYT